MASSGTRWTRCTKAWIQENANLLGIATRESRMREPGIRATRCDALDGARAEKS